MGEEQEGEGRVIQIVFGEVRSREAAIDSRAPTSSRGRAHLGIRLWIRPAGPAPPCAGRLPGVRWVKPRMERMQNKSAKCQQCIEMSGSSGD